MRARSISSALDAALMISNYCKGKLCAEILFRSYFFRLMETSTMSVNTLKTNNTVFAYNT